ncbi:bile acid:sodium symporter family protein [Nocardia brasiliensis]|uniref:bile acid:sodium symporter family protein n=1 Tax=Nocardia brasiliensis TaxID=37326 RepID=UPI003D8F8D44
MDSPIFAVFLPAALGAVMAGLGLSLTIDDFTRVLRFRRTVIVALFCQIVVLPAICLGLVLLLGLRGELAVGMMLLAASPGGVAANVFSHLAGGDVALNISLTAINSVLAVFTMPVVVAVATAGFLDSTLAVGPQVSKFVQVVAIVVVPVGAGMAVRQRFPRWANRLGKPTKIASVVVLLAVVVVAVIRESGTVTKHFGQLGPITLALSVASLAVGYAVPRSLAIPRKQCVAVAMEIGVHNATFAVAVASAVLGSNTMALPAALYGIIMFVPAALAATLLARHGRARRDSGNQPTSADSARRHR